MVWALLGRDELVLRFFVSLVTWRSVLRSRDPARTYFQALYLFSLNFCTHVRQRPQVNCSTSRWGFMSECCAYLERWVLRNTSKPSYRYCITTTLSLLQISAFYSTCCYGLDADATCVLWGGKWFKNVSLKRVTNNKLCCTECEEAKKIVRMNMCLIVHA